MDDYTRILNQINSYIKREKNIGEDQISLYDLYKKIEKYLKPLTDIFENNVITNKMNNLKKSYSIIDVFIKGTNGVGCAKYSIDACSQNNVSKLRFFMNGVHVFSICKEFDKKSLYIEENDLNIYSKKRKEYEKNMFFIIDKFFSNIKKQLNIIEEYSKVIGEIGKDISCYNIKDLFDITIICTSYCIRYEIKLNKKYNKDNIYNRNWLNRPSLKDIVNENIIDIFKNTFVNKKDLDERFKIILNEYELLEQNSLKVKSKLKK